ncbi:dihydropyrimidinase [Bengtsoniella intestinalis]|uniref:dihydropyrimidinase n=1 Tax=Bengtsoniella intestinalis TaxID=3073143 RepID=UPI00391F3DA5
MKRLLQGGTIVTGHSTRKADVLIDGETIAKIASTISPDQAEVVEDVTGCYLFPGFIDAHTHFDLPVCGTITADDFASGSLAAIAGGTTTVVDFATPNKGESLQFGLDTWMAKAEGTSHCDYSFHMTIDDWNPSIQAEIPKMFEQGISSFKMYLTYPAMMIGDGAVYEGLQQVSALGGLVGVHCENAGVIDARIAQFKAAGDTAPTFHPKSRPAALEAEAVSRLLRIAQVADSPVMVVHLTNSDAMAEVQTARKRGQTVFVETCPHYLVLDETVYDQAPFIEAAKYICAPPIRHKDNQDVLWKAMGRGQIQTIGSDHCAFTLDQHMVGDGDFSKTPGGLPSVEYRGVLLYSYGVATGKITLSQMCRVLSENQAKLYGMYPKKGALQVGSDADIVVYDTNAHTTITHDASHSAAGYSPYDGFKTVGSIRQVYLRGQLKAHGDTIASSPDGKFQKRGKSQWKTKK